MKDRDLKITWMVQALKGLHADVRGYAEQLEQTPDEELKKEAIAKAEALKQLITALRPFIQRSQS